MRCPNEARFRFLQGQAGFTLIEVIIALGILGVIGVAFLTALNTASRSTSLYEQRVTAASLAQSQTEEIKASSYSVDNGTYSVSVSAPPGYDISIATVQLEPDKQEVTVKVSKDGHYLFELATIKTNWR